MRRRTEQKALHRIIGWDRENAKASQTRRIKRYYFLMPNIIIFITPSTPGPIPSRSLCMPCPRMFQYSGHVLKRLLSQSAEYFCCENYAILNVKLFGDLFHLNVVHKHSFSNQPSHVGHFREK